MQGLRVELVAFSDSSSGRQWFARLDGHEFPVVSYALESGPDGPLLSLVLAPSSVTVGDPSTGAPAPVVRDAAPELPLSVWGAPGRPDPREGMPGWPPQGLTATTAAVPS